MNGVEDLAAPADVAATIADFDLERGSETVPLDAADGRVLADRVDATMDVPGFDRASMDGYAVRAADTAGASESAPVELDCVGTVHTGERPDVTVDPGACVQVSTGAVHPPGADAVVIVERTTREGDDVAVRTAVSPGENVALAGYDVSAGERALGPGTVLTAREVGLLAALGRETVPVRERPRVAIVSTGAELVAVGEDLDPQAGEIYDVNARTVAAATRDAGGEPAVAPRVPDDTDELADALGEAAADADLVVTSGSTSAGDVDVLADVVVDRGTVAHHGVAIKPGKPTIVGRVDGTPYVGLPGYPVSALSIFRTFVAPAIRAAAGRPPLATPERRATMGEGVRFEGDRKRLLPVGLVEDGDGATLAYPVDRGSGATTSLARADGVVEMARERTRLDTGESVTVGLFGTDVRPPRLLGVGEDGPVLSRLLDAVPRTRYLPVGSAEGVRRLADGVPDVAVVAGDGESTAEGGLDGDFAAEGQHLGGWTRRWGLVTAPDAPVDGLADLVDGDHSFVNRTASGLRGAFDDALDALAVEHGTDRAALVDRIRGYEREVRGHEAPARRVLDGRADVGLGLAATAGALDLGFVGLGTQPVHVVAGEDRLAKSGVSDLDAALSTPPDWLADLRGVTWEPTGE